MLVIAYVSDAWAGIIESGKNFQKRIHIITYGLTYCQPFV